MTITQQSLRLVAAIAVIAVSLAVFGVSPAYAASDRTEITNPRDYTEDVVFEDFVVFESTTTSDLGTTTTYRDNTPNAASTTPFQFQAPTTGTSTLDRFSMYLTVSSSTASTITIGKGSGSTATTSILATVSVSAGAQVTSVVMATSTSSGVAPAFVFGPGEYLVVGMQGGTGTFSPSGTAAASFTTVPAS